MDAFGFLDVVGFSGTLSVRLWLSCGTIWPTSKTVVRCQSWLQHNGTPRSLKLKVTVLSRSSWRIDVVRIANETWNQPGKHGKTGFLYKC
jgi:hypothetical protein